MKTYKKTIAYALTAILFLSCTDEENIGSNQLSIANFHPTIVMEGTEITITGTSLDQVTEIIFPGQASSTPIQTTGNTLTVTAPAGISEQPGSITLKTNNSEATSRQTIRKAKPEFHYITPSGEAKTYENLTITGNDLLLADIIQINNGQQQTNIQAINFIRKSNTQIIINLPPTTPLGEQVQLTTLFKNGETLPLTTLRIEEGQASGGAWVEKELTLYTGDPVEMGNWSGAITNISPTNFTDAKAGDVIRVYITDPSDDYQQGSLKNGDTWNGLTDELGLINLTEQDFTNGYYQATITDEITSQLQQSGLIVSGCNHTATKVSLFTSVWIENDDNNTQTDPITDRTIILNDFEDNGEHNAGWDASWTNSEATEFITDNTGNTYLRMKESMDDGWIINCNHVDRGTVNNIENYYIKLDILIENGVEGASAASMQLIIADNWCWVGEGMFPETTNGKWITIRFDAAQWFQGDLTIGTETNGLYGGPLPAGICIDNLRIDPK